MPKKVPPPNPEPEEEFDPEELRKLDNDLGEVPPEEPDEEFDEDIMQGPGCDCPDCQGGAEPSISKVKMAQAAIPSSKELSMPEMHAIIRACIPRNAEEGIIAPPSLGELDEVAFGRIDELAKSIRETVKLRDKLEELGIATTRDLGLQVASIAEEVGKIGSVLAKLAALSR